MGRIEFKPTISLDTVIALVVLMITIGGFAINVDHRLTSLEVQVAAMWVAFLKGGH